jgi:hypothetical protein
LTPILGVGDPLLEEAAFIAAALREGSLTARQVTELAISRLVELHQQTSLRTSIDAALRAADALDLSPATRHLALAGVPIIRVGTDAYTDGSWKTALVRAGAILIAEAEPDPLSMDLAAEAVAAGAAAFAIVPSALAVQTVRTHRYQAEREDCSLLARSSRDLAIATDARDGAVLADDSSATLCRRMTDSVGKGLGALSIALHPGATAMAGAVNSYAGFQARISPLSPEQWREASGRSFDEFDVVLSSEPKTFAFAATLAVPMLPDRQIYACGKNRAAVFRVGAVLDAAALTQPMPSEKGK